MSKFKIVTCCNRKPIESYYILDEFVRSLGQHTPVVLSEQFGGRWGGLASKPKWLYKAIVEKVIDTKHLIFCDCWDLVFAADPDMLFQNYLTMDSPFVISAEKNCFPADLKDEYDKLPSTSSYKYLNSGMIVAETDAMLAVLEAMDLPNLPDDYYDPIKNCNVHPNDQYEYMKLFLKQPVPMKLDYDQLLCNTLHQVAEDELDFSEERIRNKETGTYPCSFHANGGAKDSGIVPPILRHLNLL